MQQGVYTANVHTGQTNTTTTTKGKRRNTTTSTTLAPQGIGNHINW